MTHDIVINQSTNMLICKINEIQKKAYPLCFIDFFYFFIMIIIMIILILLIGGLFPSPNGTLGLIFLREYDLEYFSYHHLSVGLDGRGYHYSDSDNSIGGDGNFNYYRRTYSNSKDYYFNVYPYQFMYYNEGNFFFSSILDLQGGFKLYPFSVSFFTLVEGDLYGSYEEMSETHTYKNGTAEVKMGLGFGKIIPLFDAYKTLKIEEELIDLVELSGRFDIRELEKISDQIMRKNKYLDERDFWKDLDSIITETESFKQERMNAVSAIRIDEILNSSFKRRGAIAPYISGIDRGYETGLYFGYRYRYTRSIDEGSDEDQKREEEGIYSGIRYDFAHPLSVKLHLYGHSLGEGYLSDSLGLKEVNFRVGLVYEVFNNFFSDLSIEYCNRKNRYLTGPADAEYISLDLRNIYYIDYKLSISVYGHLYYYSRIRDDDSNVFSGQLRTSIDYNFF